jgi:hypothetical protein
MPQRSKIREEIVAAKEKIVQKMKLQQLEANKKVWFVHHRITNVWALFVVNNHLEKIMVGSSLTLKCLIYHPIKQCHSSGSTIRFQKGLVTYNPQHGITFMKNHIIASMGQWFLSTKIIAQKKLNLLALDMRKTRNARGLHLLPSLNILEVNNFTRVLIQRRYVSSKT